MSKKLFFDSAYKQVKILKVPANNLSDLHDALIANGWSNTEAITIDTDLYKYEVFPQADKFRVERTKKADWTCYKYTADNLDLICQAITGKPVKLDRYIYRYSNNAKKQFSNKLDKIRAFFFSMAVIGYDLIHVKLNKAKYTGNVKIYQNHSRYYMSLFDPAGSQYYEYTEINEIIRHLQLIDK